MTVEIRPGREADQEWVRRFLLQEAGSLRMVTRGRMHALERLPALIALLDGDRAGLLAYTLENGEMEVVTLHAARPGAGVGTALLDAARTLAREAGCRRLWLVTTNDNEPAIRFYERRGMRLTAVHKDAILESRKLKPEIPLTGVDDKPIRDEIEFEYRLE